MDYETVIPFKTVNDIVKELKESEIELDTLPLAEESRCGCGHCNCEEE